MADGDEAAIEAPEPDEQAAPRADGNEAQRLTDETVMHVLDQAAPLTAAPQDTGRVEF